MIFGEEADATVLGVHTLETLGLEVDPGSQQLRPKTLEFFVWAGHGFSERGGAERRSRTEFTGSRAAGQGFSGGFSP